MSGSSSGNDNNNTCERLSLLFTDILGDLKIGDPKGVLWTPESVQESLQQQQQGAGGGGGGLDLAFTLVNGLTRSTIKIESWNDLLKRHKTICPPWVSETDLIEKPLISKLEILSFLASSLQNQLLPQQQQEKRRQSDADAAKTNGGPNITDESMKDVVVDDGMEVDDSDNANNGKKKVAGILSASSSFSSTNSSSSKKRVLIINNKGTNSNSNKKKKNQKKPTPSSNNVTATASGDTTDNMDMEDKNNDPLLSSSLQQSSHLTPEQREIIIECYYGLKADYDKRRVGMKQRLDILISNFEEDYVNNNAANKGDDEASLASIASDRTEMEQIKRRIRQNLRQQQALSASTTTTTTKSVNNLTQQELLEHFLKPHSKGLGSRTPVPKSGTDPPPLESLTIVDRGGRTDEVESRMVSMPKWSS